MTLCLLLVIQALNFLADVGLNISQLLIPLRILLYKLGAKLFEPEHKMKELCGESFYQNLVNIAIFVKMVPNLSSFHF